MSGLSDILADLDLFVLLSSSCASPLSVVVLFEMPALAACLTEIVASAVTSCVMTAGVGQGFVGSPSKAPTPLVPPAAAVPLPMPSSCVWGY